MKYLVLLLTGWLIGVVAWAQEPAYVEGTVRDADGVPIELATVVISETNRGTATDENGYFRLRVLTDRPVTCVVRFIGYKTQTFALRLEPGQTERLAVMLESDSRVMEEVEVQGNAFQDNREEVSLIKLNPRVAETLPTPFGEFNKLLATLPGVVSNNELSSAYSVRGGSFEENLVYVNDIEVYRPFLASAGRQEGLSFINPNLVSNVEFSAGGWQPRFGDKLSSVLNVSYRRPSRFAATAGFSLLGGNLHLEGATRDDRVTFLVGARQKSARYLFNTFEVQGEYLPRFYDAQSYVTIDLTPKASAQRRRTTLGLLTSLAFNNYFVEPRSQESTFGSFTNPTRISVGFIGQETYDYNTWQQGFRLSHRFRPHFRSDLIGSVVNTREREDVDVEGGYRLCDVSNDPGSDDFNECVNIRGIGSFYNYARNVLRARLYQVMNRNYYDLNQRHRFEFGFNYRYDDIEDILYEYSFVDSADFVSVTDFRSDSLTLPSNRIELYGQHTLDFQKHRITYGARLNYWEVNQQLLFSPRLQYTFLPKWRRDIIFKGAVGVYQQPPFYRELRDRTGNLNLDVRAQRSYHFIGGMDYSFFIWNRPFKITVEGYGKHLTDVIPYDVENVRLRYFARNNATAYAVGADFRINGEFIRGAESWFSVGLLQTREDVEGDGRGYIRRPTDQRLTVGIMFQDHLPNNPSVRVYVNSVFGSGLPQNPPDSINLRGVFTTPAFWRTDIGFTKLVVFQDEESKKPGTLKSVWMTLELLNAFGFNNVISYQWIQDVNNQFLRVPNTLSARYLNLRVMARF